MRSRVKLRRRSAIEEPEIIVIPMIDVMMFLLFFFMVASLAMAVQNGIPVNLPKASSGKDERSQTVTITLQPNGSIFLNTSPIKLADLSPKLKALGVTSKTLVTINSDDKVPYGTIVSVMDEARQSGVLAFAFATSRK